MEIQSRSGRSSIIFEDWQWVSSYFNRHPKTLIQTAERRLLRNCIQRILQNRFHLIPYKLHIIKALEECDYETRTKFDTWCLQNTESDLSFFNGIIFSDECVFHKSGKVNIHNVRIWRFINYHEIKEGPRNSERVTEWSAFSIGSVIGPYCFDDPFVTGVNYFHLLNNYILPILLDFPANNIFQHGGAPPHYNRKYENFWMKKCQIHGSNVEFLWIGQLTSLILHF